MHALFQCFYITLTQILPFIHVQKLFPNLRELQLHRFPLFWILISNITNYH